MIGEFFRKLFFGRTVKEYGPFIARRGTFGAKISAFISERGPRRRLVLRTSFGANVHFQTLEKEEVENLLEVLTDARELM